MPGTDLAAQAATQKSALPLKQTSLIGTFGTTEKRHALIRHASGRIQRVRPGDRVKGRQILSIEPGALVLRAGSGDLRLEMPAG